ncbi:MAG: hypothetical protein WC640_02875 [Candidatus Paceibacterota bacterium]|jgi:hypothetical protein
MIFHKKIFGKGFVLLYAILLTGVVTVVGIVLMNILTKQIIFSSIGQGSESAYYYTANSGRECANAFSKVPGKFYSCSTVFAPPLGANTTCEPNPEAISLSCFNVGFNLDADSPTINGGIYQYQFHPANIAGTSGSIDLLVSVNPSCLGKKMSIPRHDCAPSGDPVYNRYGLVIESSGYSMPIEQANNPRRIKRTAIMVRY